MKRLMIKFPENFFMGMLVGFALATMLIGSLAYSRVEVNRTFAEDMANNYVETLKQLEELKKKCGISCDESKIKV